MTVFGGSVDVLGDMQGDLGVFGGSAHVHDGGEVHGDAVTLGGSLEIDDGATVDGDVTRIGGSFASGTRRTSAARCATGTRGASASRSPTTTTTTKPRRRSRRSEVPGKVHSHLTHFAKEVGATLTSSSILFAFGAVLLALATKRMDRIKVEVASRPMRSFALGIVGGLLGIVALVGRSASRSSESRSPSSASWAPSSPCTARSPRC